MTEGDTLPTPAHHPPIRAARMRTGVQILGFMLGLTLLAWCIYAAAKPENLKQWSRLREAPAESVAMLLALSLATVVLNGAIFQFAIRPIARLRAADIQSVNAVASLLAYLPFKLSMLFRVLVHNRRDGLALFTIAAWFGAIAASMAIGVLPPLAFAWVRGRADAGWWAASLGGVIGATVATVVMARLLHAGPGWAWFERTWNKLPLRALLPRIHEGLRMLADPRAVITCVVLRLLDSAVHTARFLVAASILGFDLPTDKAVIAGCSFFLIGIAAPSGTVGVREAFTGGLLGQLLSGVDPDQFFVAVLLVSAAEAVVTLPAALLGAAWIKPWRLRRTPSTALSPATPAQLP